MLPLLLVLLAPDADPKAKPDPALVRAKLLAQATFAFDRYVFAGKNFPAGKVRHDPALADAFGPDTPIKVRFFDISRRPVTKPETAGPYAAVVTIEPKGERPLTRFITLYRAAAEKGGLSAVAGGAGKAVERNKPLVDRVLGDKSVDQWVRDPEAARLLAGLALSEPLETAARKWEDAFAAERQWWVDIKCDRIYPGIRLARGKFTGPGYIPNRSGSPPAPELREGTEEEAGFKKGTAAKIDAVLSDFAKDTDQAFAVCIARKGVIVLHKAYGERDGKPMTVNTPSWMASVTKTMSATLMLQLIDQGEVKLTDPVSKYLPALRDIEQKVPLTIHHLYTHTNGLTMDGLPGWNDEIPDVAERIAAYYDKLRVGQEWAYTGTGNMLGSKALEMLTGKAVPQAYHEYLLKPLGCTNTQVTDTHAGAYSVPLDMAKFAQMLLNKGAYGGRRFFREETFEKVMLPGDLKKLGGGKRVFGFGLDGSKMRFGHGTASGASFSIDAERQLIFIMTRNKYGKNQDKYNGLIWKAIDEGVVK